MAHKAAGVPGAEFCSPQSILTDYPLYQCFEVTHALNCVQVRKALNALDAAKAERTEEGKRIMAKPIPGLMMGDVKTDFELTFGQNLVYSELGHKKLREVIVNECGDFLKPPADQYVMEVSLPRILTSHIYVFPMLCS